MNASAGQMKATLGLDVSQFETKARGAADTARKMGADIARSVGSGRGGTDVLAASFDHLRASIDPAFAASQRYGNLQRQIAAYVDQGVVSQRTANLVLEQAASKYMGVASASERVEQAQRQQAQALAQTSASYQSLRSSIDPVYASSKRYESAVETADAALKAKIITEGEHARVLQLAQQRYLGLTPAISGATGGLAKFTPQITNASFQVQDFAVQVASGQSALTAFTQQFPQLAGALGFSGKLALLGAGLGTLVAVGAAVAPMFFDIGEGAKSADDAISDLAEVVSEYRRYAQDATQSNADLMAQFGNLYGEARRVSEALAQITRIEAIEAMDAAVKNLAETFGGLVDAPGPMVPGPFRESITVATELSKTIDKMSRQMGISEDQARRVANALAAWGDAPIGDQTAAARELHEELLKIFGSVEAIPPELREADVQALRLALSAGEVAGSIHTINDLAAEIQGLLAAAGNTLGIAISNTDAWATSMSGVRAEVLGIASAMSQIGGGMISNAAAFVEVNALKAGKSIADARMEVEKFKVAAKYDGEIAAAESRGGVLGWTEAQALKAAKALELSGLAAAEEATELRKVAMQSERASAGRSKSTASASKASRVTERLAGQLDKEADRWRETLDPMVKYRREMDELNKLTGRLSADEMAQAQRNLNAELADGIPLAGGLVDTLSEGMLDGFAGALDRIKSMFSRWLSDMIAMALKNQIVVNMGASFGGPMGIAGGLDALSRALGAAGAPVGGAGGVLGGINSGISAFGGGLWGGASSVIGGLTSGGLSGGIGAIGSALGGATSGLAGLGTAIGAIALPVAAVAAVFSFFKSKTKQLDAGLRVTIDGFETLAETFSKVEKKRFWGLSKSVRTSYDRADAETQQAVARAVGTLQQGILSAADVLGFGARAFAGFAHTLKVSTKGLSEDEARAEVEKAILGLGDSFASMVPGLTRLTLDGETATDAISRLAQSLVSVNGVMDTLGHRFKAVGLQGAALASDIAALFGGLDAMASATQSYYEAFYTDAERLKVTARQTTTAVRDLGLAMPTTRAEYRAIVEAMDLTTVKGRETYAALIGMAGAMDQVLPTIAGFTKQMERMQNSVAVQIGNVIALLDDAIRTNATAASDWRKAGDSIRDYLEQLRGTASALVSPMQARNHNRTLYGNTLKAAQNGDVEAAGNLASVASAFLGSVNDTARSRVEAALAQARVQNQMGAIADKSASTATILDKVAGLQQKQVDILTGVQDHLNAGNSLTRDGITRLIGQLGGLDERIARQAGDAGVIVAGFNDALASTGFSANVSISGASALRTAMGELNASLVRLRAAIVAEDKRKEAAVSKAAASANTKPKTKGPKVEAPKYSAKDFDGYSYSYGGVMGSDGDRWGQQYGWKVRGPLGGTKSFDSKSDADAWLRRNNFPAFAMGGVHTGGLRIVGERGPELEATGPSRIYNNNQTRDLLGNKDVVKAIGKLWSEMKSLREEQRQLLLSANENSRKTKNTLEKWDRVAVPTREVAP